MVCTLMSHASSEISYIFMNETNGLEKIMKYGTPEKLDKKGGSTRYIKVIVILITSSG